MTRVVSKKLRDSARDQTCTLRLQGCGYDDGTVVLAHLPCGQKGMGMKGPDVIACFACDSCHSIIDGRKRGEYETADLLRALAETQVHWIERGLLKVA
ncbi:nuclease domain-containing protein [Pseudomonas sp. UMAB-08]|uniref:nuclease domain-containing protein n=1 Tax=Pseudomonas sp. UMAB-08 TaxID=1365375 RepID=UPI001C56C4F4|nr:nuclease domain-containing protein [Pseudomonas sp. UMAB-08]